MSEIKVDVVSPYTGTGLQIGENGDTVTVPSGATLAVASGATLANAGTATGFPSGAWTAKDSGTVTTSSGMVVTGITSTTMIFLNLKQSAVHGSIILLTSSNGGSSYDSGSTDYYRNNWDLDTSDSTPSYNKGDLSRFLLHGAKGSSNPAGDYISMAVRIIRPQDSFSETIILSDYSGICNPGSGDQGVHGHSGGYRKSVGIVNAIQIKAYSGTMTGTYEIIHL